MPNEDLSVTSYVAAKEMEDWRTNGDPITTLKAAIVAADKITEQQYLAIEADPSR